MTPSLVTSPTGKAKQFDGKITIYVGSAMTLTSQVKSRRWTTSSNNYCKYDDQNLQLFTSSLYMAALVANFAASEVCSKHGCKLTRKAASVFFLLGVLLNAVAPNIALLIVRPDPPRIRVVFANQAVPLFSRLTGKCSSCRSVCHRLAPFPYWYTMTD